VLHGAYESPISGSLQLVVVVTDGWDSVPGTMQRYQRDGVRSRWRAYGSQVPVVVGATGLGWGIGLHGVGSPGEPGPVKHEGDQRSPAGVFRLTSAFGYAPHDSMSWVDMPYVQAVDEYKCVDDSASVHYNQMVMREAGTPADWRSAEDMHRPDSLYELGVVVEHNANGRKVGGGSCIFLHIWPGPQGSTVGCTAFASSAMKELLQWLEPESLPVLVQLTRGEYERLRTAWELP
jgi:D-alanyl-D-alanine dipeptidase